MIPDIVPQMNKCEGFAGCGSTCISKVQVPNEADIASRCWIEMQYLGLQLAAVAVVILASGFG